jgi:hypothetical protein
MNKLKTFFYIFKNSITSPEYYKELLETKFAYTIKYYVMLSLFLSLIVTSFLSIKMIPGSKEGLRLGTEEIKKTYPDDLTISVKDGSWTINKPEPYVIPLPEFSKTKENTGIDNILVFYKQGTIDDFNNFKTFALVNETNILAKDSNSSIKVTPIKELPNFDLNKTKVNEFFDKLYSYLKYVPFFLPLFIFIWQMLFNFLGVRIFYILWIGLVVYLFSLIRKNKVSYKSACRVAIHTMTIPLILEVVLSFVDFTIPLSSWFFIINIILSIVVLERLSKEKTETLNPKI